MAPRGLPAHPAAVARGAGDAAVRRHGPLCQHVGRLGGDIVEKDLVDGIALRAQDILGHLDARRAQPLGAAPRHERVGVARPDDRACDAGVGQGVGARGLVTMVAARLERDVHRRAPRVLSARPAVAQRFALGVQVPVAAVPPLADHASVAHEHRADQRVRVRTPRTAQRQLKRAAHVTLLDRQRRPPLRAGTPVFRQALRAKEKPAGTSACGLMESECANGAGGPRPPAAFLASFAALPSGL